MNRGTAIVGFLLCLLAGMGMMWGLDRSGAPRGASEGSSVTAEAFSDAAWTDEDAALPISSKDAAWGSRNAPVTLVLFSDYQCPFCSKVEETIGQLKTKYGPEKLRVVWKNNPLPFHKDARPAAVAGETVFRLAGNKAFWRWHETAFQNQQALTPENFEAWAVAAGVDKAKYHAAVEKQEFAAKIDADLAAGKSAGVSGTPASFINGVFLSGAQPLEKFTQVIDEQLAAAKAKIASGTKADKVYAALVAENKAKNPQPDAKKQPDAKPQEDDKTVWKVPVGSSPIRGNVNAPVTLVIFSDFQCPFCGRVEPTLDELAKTYGEKLRFVWKNEPLSFHQRAEPLAEMAMEARAEKGDKGFWAAHDLLFKNQQKQSDEDILGYAKELGLDEKKVDAAMKTHKYKADMAVDMDLAEDLGASGTPNMYINGRHIVGAQPVENFKKLIDEELKKAEGLLAKGIKADKIYDEVMKEGKEPPPPETKTIDAPAAESPFKGGEKAKIVMQIFSDFQCPFCKRAEDTVAEVERAYGDKLKIVWRHKPLPMHKDAPLAAEASQEAYAQKGNAGFWKFHDALFKAQGTPDALARTGLEKVAEEQGLDLAKFKKSLDTNNHKAFVDSESAVADKAQISGTPAFIVGTVKGNSETGYFISGAQPFTKFKKLIDKAFKDAGEKIPPPPPEQPAPAAPKGAPAPAR